MDHPEPKTRKEVKGRDKRHDTMYSKKHVRQMEKIMEKRVKTK